MKKLITSLISLLLAGSMTFGLAACNPDSDKTDNGNSNDGGGGNQGESGNQGEGGNTPGGGNEGDEGEPSLADAIDATYALDNFTLTETEKIGGEIKYDGQAMDTAAATSYGTVDLGDGTPIPLTFSTLSLLVSDDDDLTITENPFVTEEKTFEYKYDYSNGKISDSTYRYWDSNAGKSVEYIGYYEAENAEIKFYGQDIDDGQTETYNTLKVYSGYGDAAAAKAALKEQVPPELADYLNSTFGMGEIGSDDFKEGEFADFIDDFTLGADGKTFSAPLLPEYFFDQPFEFSPKLSLVVENGKISSVDMQVPMTMNLADLLMMMVGGESDPSAPKPAINWADEGEHEIIINSYQSYTYVISDVGSTTVDIPAERKNVTGEHSETEKVITDFQSAVSPISSTDGTVSFYYSKNESGENFYLNTALGLLLHRHSENGELKYAKLYFVSGTELKTYEATIEGEGYEKDIAGWGTPTTTAVSDDVISEFKKLLPEEGKMCFSIGENYDKIETYDFNSYSVEIDGKEVRLSFEFDSDGGAHLRYYAYQIKEGNDTKFIDVNFNTNWNITAMKLPESVGNEPVDAAKWSELADGWNSFESLTVEQGREKTYIVKGANGTVTIAVVGERENYFGVVKYVTYTPKSGDEGLYDMVKYSYEYEWDDDSYSWVKTEEVTAEIGYDWDSIYYLTEYLTENRFQFSGENKTLAEMTAKYDNLINAYRIADESADYVLRFNDDGSLEFCVFTNYGSTNYVKFTDKNKTTLPQLPQEAQDAATSNG